MKPKDVYTLSLNLMQILSKRMLAQAMFSYNFSKGYLGDPYQVVQIIEGNTFTNHETVHPGQRVRTALGLRMNYKIYKDSALHLGVRYYWDDWDVRSFTGTFSFRQHVSEFAIVSLGLRTYVQGRAFFFKPRYDTPEPYMTVDSKLDKAFSNELQFVLNLNGGPHSRLPFLANEHMQFNLRLNFYHRRTATPNWHSRSKDLYAYILSMGVRYHF